MYDPRKNHLIFKKYIKTFIRIIRNKFLCVAFFYFLSLVSPESRQANAALLMETEEVRQSINQLNLKVQLRSTDLKLKVKFAVILH